jgi:hypothetical protein
MRCHSATVHQPKHEWQRIMQAMLNWYETQARACGVRSNPIEKTATAKTDAAQAAMVLIVNHTGEDRLCEAIGAGPRRDRMPQPPRQPCRSELPRSAPQPLLCPITPLLKPMLCVDLAENVKGGAGHYLWHRDTSCAVMGWALVHWSLKNAFLGNF